VVVGMKKQVVLIHGGSAFSNHEDFLNYLRQGVLRNPFGEKVKRWKDSLRGELGTGYEVFTPQMPNAENAHYDEWSIWFERHLDYLQKEAVLIGWSLGGMFLAKYLSEKRLPFTLKSLILLATPCGSYADESGDDCGTFQFIPENLVSLSVQVKDIQIWHSKDDFVVPYEHALLFKKYLPDAKLVTFSDKNHFLLEEFPELVEAIEGVG
jgi:predicted alpha/beta hydrolase family esterase